jgi:hypothetical protein
MESFFGMLAGGIVLIAFVPYTFSILRGETRPSRASWLIWFLMDVAVVLSYRAVGATDTLWIGMGLLCGSTLVMTLSIFYGEGRLTRLEGWCLFGAALSTIAWIFSGPAIALLLYLIIDTFAYAPTIKKAYMDPESEDKWAWGITFTGVLVNLLAIPTSAWQSVNIEILSFPIYLLVFDAVVIWGLWRPRR